ncbi:hypothetical protein D3C84_1040250 [compost metagenome]
MDATLQSAYDHYDCRYVGSRIAHRVPIILLDGGIYGAGYLMDLFKATYIVFFSWVF